MKIKYGPRVVRVGETVPNWETIQALSDILSPEGEHKLEEDAFSSEVLPIFAGRVCYQSFGSRAGRKTAEDYLGHIKEVEHWSIMEHCSVSYYIDGVSRAFSHEAVTHRHQSKSQLSQRFVAPNELSFVVPPRYRENPEVVESLMDGWREATWLYNKLLKEETPEMSFAEKKQIREAARCVLPNATETKMVWSGNLTSWYHLLQKRMHPSADLEFREVATMIYEDLSRYAGNIFSAKEPSYATG